MREAIGGTFLFQIVIVFVMLFTGFMCLTINRSKAYSVKDQIIQSIQSYNGIDLTTYSGDENTAMGEILEYIRFSSYRNTGVNPGEGYECFNKDGVSTERNPVFCIKENSVENQVCPTGANCFPGEFPSMVYYSVVVFYQLDLPIFHDFFNFKVVGDTKILYGGAK